MYATKRASAASNIRGLIVSIRAPVSMMATQVALRRYSQTLYGDVTKHKSADYKQLTKAIGKKSGVL
jgi:hypothetical protein